MTDEEKLERVNKDIDDAQRAYAEECAKLANQPGFDQYSKKWQKKIDKIADKYSRILYPLQVEHEEIRERLNDAEEENRKKQYTGSYQE